MPTLFLVRLRWEFRYDSGEQSHTIGGWRNPHVAPYERAFLRREDAERFCCDTAPIHANPFEDEVIFVNFEWDTISSHTDTEETAMKLSFFCEWLRDTVGVTHPVLVANPPAPKGTFSPEAWLWQEWWRTEIAPKATDAQKSAIWRILAPTPYEIVETKLEE